MNQLSKLILCLIPVVSLVLCTTQFAGNGGSSETLNAQISIKDTALSITIEEKPVELLTCHLFSSTYKPYDKIGFHDSNETTHSSQLLWRLPPKGIFNALVTTGNTELNSFLPNLNIETGIDTTFTVILKPGLTICGRIDTPDSTTVQEPYLVSIYGTPFCTVTDNVNDFSFPVIPDGKFIFKVRPLTRKLFLPTSDFFVITDSLPENFRLHLSLP